MEDALELVNLLDLADRQIGQLSGGHFQRVLIARCLVQEADVIFLDEPFAGIDSVSEDIIMQTLHTLKKEGKTILIVHHDLSKVTSYFDQVIFLHRKLIAFGKTEDTFTKENLHAAYGLSLIHIWAHGLPLIPVNHMAGHLMAAREVQELEYPLLALLVSGGHTELVYVSAPGNYKIVGETRDDAVGEAYDKVGRVMGLTYPAGREIDELAHKGKDVYDFPRAMIKLSLIHI